MQHVSFIVPAWNEELLLPRMLEAIHEAARLAELSYQVVVADDAWTDRTAEVVACDNRQIAVTRKRGARASDGDLLFFVDADTCVTPAAVRAAVEAIECGATWGGADLTWDRPITSFECVMLHETCRMTLGGSRALRSRSRLGLWYDERRDDPQPPAD